MIQKDKNTDKTHELKKKLNDISLAISKVETIERKAINKGNWNEDYIKNVFKEFIIEMSFSIEEIENYIEDEMLSKNDGKKIPKHILFETRNQLPN